MTAEQLRAARAMLRWDQTQIAVKADVSVETIKRLEKMDGPLLDARGATIAAIRKAFERVGVAFTDENNGVSLKARPAKGR
jgi:transcriptional regulator with XRE-family HTH domain